jgi:hypothetical protein
MIAGLPQPAVSAEAGRGSVRLSPSTFRGSALSRFRHSFVTAASGRGTAAVALSSLEEQPVTVISTAAIGTASAGRP